jgi:hypothetical protein
MKFVAGSILMLLAYAFIGNSNNAFCGWTEPVPVQELNMSGDELFPYLSSDGQILLFSASGTVTMSHRNGESWGPREYMPSPINYIGLQDQAAITPDKCWIYWVSWRAGGMGAWDIWRSTWNDSSRSCGQAECLGSNINSQDMENGICFSADGRRLYFVTNTHSKNGQVGHGSDDIWYCDWDSLQGDWGLPYNLGPLINTSDIEDFPSISGDGNLLYFACPGGHRVPGWQGGYDIYVAQKNGNTWETVTNLLPPVNSPTWELGPSISFDNTKLYFNTPRDRNPSADYELMISIWDPNSVPDDIVPIDHSIWLECYPNPFNEQIEIKVHAEEEAIVKMSIYDIKGGKVSEYDLRLNNGAGMTTWDSKNQKGQKVGTGNYILKINFPNGKEIRRVITLLK